MMESVFTKVRCVSVRFGIFRHSSYRGRLVIVGAVTAAPAVKTIGNSYCSICGGKDGGALGAGNVSAGVGTDLAGDRVYAVAEL